MTEGETRTLKQRIHRFKAWVRLKVPNGFRFGLGVVLMLCGLVGFLPVLGFWMLPLGAAIAAMDIKWLKRKFKAAPKNNHKKD
ncbi:hypothetical protein shim_16540 [Shimia sp. SK013]|uniref:hypothetical protein n=1 Tax=Shimia sp. SK013 TaxID=1389006 RepID=UPI0006B63613|nr:hypothetical protein [Shimia sp. SK013]KPA22207.1 hypothetical protein shim_16540 [Shimia sp. SK013]